MSYGTGLPEAILDMQLHGLLYHASISVGASAEMSHPPRMYGNIEPQFYDSGNCMLGEQYALGGLHGTRPVQPMATFV